MKGLKKLELCLIFVFLALIVHCIGTSTKHLQGDGYEYLVMTQSILNHSSPDMRLQDVNDAEAQLVNNAKPHVSEKIIFDSYRKMIETKDSSIYGYFKSKHDEFYSYHFWVYPLVNVPALWITQVLNWSPVRSFIITNLAIFIFTVVFLCRTRILNKKQRYFITAFYIFSGTTYYLGWSHPEVFSGSLFLIGLVLLLGRRWLLAALLMAVAAQQNPPIGIIAGFILVFKSGVALVDLLKHQKTGLTIAKEYLMIGVIGLLLILSPLFYYAHFAKTNLIVFSGASKSSLISIDRLFSLYFDFNQGMIISIPCAMILLAILLVGFMATFLLGKLKQSGRSALILALGMIAISLIVAIPALSTSNWNPGSSIFLRYVYWISMPIGMATMLLIAELPLTMYLVSFVLCLLGQAALLFSYSLCGSQDYVFNKKIAIYLLEQHPRWYNPEMEIFVERGLRKILSADAQTIYYYVNQKGDVTKLLFHESHQNAVSPCQGQTLAMLMQSNKVISKRDGWYYINPALGTCHTHLSSGFFTLESSR